MRILDRSSAAAFLRMQGVMPETEVEKVLSGFDFTKPVYEHAFFPGDKRKKSEAWRTDDHRRVHKFD